MYKFYFDESFHDRKVVINPDSINTMGDNGLDSYIGFFWGAEESVAKSVEDDFRKLDKMFCKKLGIVSEFKGVTFDKKNYKYGIKTFNKICFQFYSELFDILDRNGIIFQYTIISKIEFLLDKIMDFSTLHNQMLIKLNIVSMKLLKYSLSKFFYIYHNKELIESLYNVHDKDTAVAFVECIKHQLCVICSAIKNIKRKEREYENYTQMLELLNLFDVNITDEKKFNFTYIPNFIGLTNLLGKINIDISNVNIYIDEEDKTVEAAKKFAFNTIESVNSVECCGVRISDFLSNFIGRMIWALNNSKNIEKEKIDNINNLHKNDLSTKRLLSDEWFDLSEEQFDLYYKIAKVLIVQHQQDWTLFTGNYFDDAVFFVELFKFFYNYKDYESYCKKDRKMLKEYFNTQVCVALSELYKKVGTNCNE